MKTGNLSLNRRAAASHAGRRPLGHSKPIGVVTPAIAWVAHLRRPPRMEEPEAKLYAIIEHNS